ncbi:MAG: hypothetical protein CMP34_00125 [Rickettsiales bacterium]|nr:hypothetical protein [Rickettsiales bacterium]
MQQGITEYKEERLEDAGRLCSTILQSLPSHPDADHNLALWMVRWGMTPESRPLFRQALDTAHFTVSAGKKLVKAGTAFFTDVLFLLAQCTRAQRGRFIQSCSASWRG